MLSGNWEFGQTLRGLFLGVDVEGGSPGGVELTREERSFLTVKISWCLSQAGTRLVSFLEIRVGSGVEFDKFRSTSTVIL